MTRQKIMDVSRQTPDVRLSEGFPGMLYRRLNENTVFGRALALQHSSRNCFPDPDLVFCRPIFLQVISSGGVFFAQTPVVIWLGHWDPFSLLPFLALTVAVFFLSSGQTCIQNPANPFRRRPVAHPVIACGKAVSQSRAL